METFYHFIGACGEHSLTHPTLWSTLAVIAAMYTVYRVVQKRKVQA